MAAELGFEPRQTESESAVLPLHNTASLAVLSDSNNYYTKKIWKVKLFIPFF